MEQARRPTLAHHVHRAPPMGARVLINETRYKLAGGPLPPRVARIADCKVSHKLLCDFGNLSIFCANIY